MKLYLKTKNVLDERETQEMYRIEHRGMWGMYALLCAAVVVQMLFGAGFAQVAGDDVRGNARLQQVDAEVAVVGSDVRHARAQRHHGCAA